MWGDIMDKKKTYTNMVNIGYTVIVLAIIYYLCNQLSDLLSRWIVIPGNIIGIGALFLLLELKIVKFERIKKTSEFLLS